MKIVAPSWATDVDQCMPRTPMNCTTKPQMLTIVLAIVIVSLKPGIVSSLARPEVVTRGCAVSGNIAKD